MAKNIDRSALYPNFINIKKIIDSDSNNETKKQSLKKDCAKESSTELRKVSLTNNTSKKMTIETDTEKVFYL